MKISPLKSEADYEKALARLEKIFHAPINSDESDEAEIIGYKSRVSEIFSGKRKMNLPMIRKLHKHLNIPYESLIAEN